MLFGLQAEPPTQEVIERIDHNTKWKGGEFEKVVETSEGVRNSEMKLKLLVMKEEEAAEATVGRWMKNGEAREMTDGEAGETSKI